VPALAVKLLLIWTCVLTATAWLIANGFRGRKLAGGITIVILMGLIFTIVYCAAWQSPLEITYESKRHDLTEPVAIQPGIHIFRVTIRNRSNHRIEGIGVTLTAPDLQLRSLPLRPTDNDASDLLGEQGISKQTFSLNHGEAQDVNVIFADPMHPKYAFIDHTNNYVSRKLQGRHTLMLEVSANDERPFVSKSFETEYRPETGALSFWQSEHKAPRVREFYGGFIHRSCHLMNNYSSLKVGDSLSLEVAWRNDGPKKLHNVYMLSRLFIQGCRPADFDANRCETAEGIRIRPNRYGGRVCQVPDRRKY